MNIGDTVKWSEVVYDSFSDPEESVEEFTGKLIAIVPGFLGIRMFGIVTMNDIPRKVLLSKLRKA